MGRAGHTTPLCGCQPFQRHQPADVVGKVLQADFGFCPRDANRSYDPATRRVLLSTERVNGVVLLADPSLIVSARRIAEVAQKTRLPTAFQRRENVEAGGLLSYGANLNDQLRQAAFYVDRILRGEKPADLPVQQPTRFELVINLKTAKALGLTIPETLLATADEVIQ